jgi:hypothetical protein
MTLMGYSNSNKEQKCEDDDCLDAKVEVLDDYQADRNR